MSGKQRVHSYLPRIQCHAVVSIHVYIAVLTQKKESASRLSFSTCNCKRNFVHNQHPLTLVFIIATDLIRTTSTLGRWQWQHSFTGSLR